MVCYSFHIQPVHYTLQFHRCELLIRRTLRHIPYILLSSYRLQFLPCVRLRWFQFLFQVLSYNLRILYLRYNPFLYMLRLSCLLPLSFRCGSLRFSLCTLFHSFHILPRLRNLQFRRYELLIRRTHYRITYILLSSYTLQFHPCVRLR
jgi:hypothetical protein